jgi:hypothetical protein
MPTCLGLKGFVVVGIVVVVVVVVNLTIVSSKGCAIKDYA